MAAAVAKRFDVNEPMAGWLVREARKRGHEVPRLRAAPEVAQAAVVPLSTVMAPVTVDNHPASRAFTRAFTPDDARGIIDG